MWGYYYESYSIKFTEKLGFYFTTSNIDMEYSGDILPEQKRDMIRKCKAEDYISAVNIWHNGMHEMRVRIGYPNSKLYEPTEQDKQNFNDALEKNCIKNRKLTL